MSFNSLNIMRIGVFYDGYYFYKVSNYYKYESKYGARFSLSGLHNYIKKEVAEITDNDIKKCQIIDSHYFKGRITGRENEEILQAERSFDDILMKENIVTHYLPMYYNESSGYKEKGIDVWLALEAYELSLYKKFDVLVLIAGDGDYVPLINKLHTIGTQVMLLCWDFEYHNESGECIEIKTSKMLKNSVFHNINMNERIDNGNEYIKCLFMEKYINKSLKENTEIEYESEIIYLGDNGFGFIKDDNYNNIFFHYSNLVNCDFMKLSKGMKIRYNIEYDPIRSKKEGAEQYKAIKVKVIGY